jgi:thiomorpholine-carboxylate dehydrogenase
MSIVPDGDIEDDPSVNPEQKPHRALPFLDEDAVARVLRLEDLIPAMERALIDFSAGQVVQPVRSIVEVREHGALMGLMPAIYGDVMGTKLVNVFPGNASLGLPTHQALIALFHSNTGEPMAVLDGRLITELRTAAVSAVATKLLASPKAKKLAILGSGVQARAHARALRLVRDFDEIFLWSSNPEHARACAEEIGATAKSAEEAVRNADVVVTVTNSPEPVLRRSWLKTGVLVNAVGAVGPTRREIDNDTMQGEVIVDSRDAAAKESGDILLAKATVYAELGELLAKTKPLPDGPVIVFKSLGIAVEDIAAARLVLGYF